MNLGWRDLIKLPVLNAYEPRWRSSNLPLFVSTRTCFLVDSEELFLSRCKKKLNFPTVNIPPNDYLPVTKKNLKIQSVVRFSMLLGITLTSRNKNNVLVDKVKFKHNNTTLSSYNTFNKSTLSLFVPIGGVDYLPVEQCYFSDIEVHITGYEPYDVFAEFVQSDTPVIPDEFQMQEWCIKDQTINVYTDILNHDAYPSPIKDIFLKFDYREIIQRYVVEFIPKDIMVELGKYINSTFTTLPVPRHCPLSVIVMPFYLSFSSKFFYKDDFKNGTLYIVERTSLLDSFPSHAKQDLYPGDVLIKFEKSATEPLSDRAVISPITRGRVEGYEISQK